MFLDSNYKTIAQGARADVFKRISDLYYDVVYASKNVIRTRQSTEPDSHWLSIRDIGHHLKAKGYLPEPDMRTNRNRVVSTTSTTEEPLSRDGFPTFDITTPAIGAPVVTMSGVQIRYGDKCVLGDWQNPSPSSPGLHWTVQQGQRWGIFGPNGSGKTTLLSLLTSDHPQSYSIPMLLFGRSRLPSPGKPGLTLWDINARLGHSSPEVHSFFPRSMTLRRALESAWADTPLSPPKLTHDIDLKVDAALRWFQAELAPSVGMTPQQKDEMLRFPGAPSDPWREIAKSGSGRGFKAPLVLEQMKRDFEDADIHVGAGLEWAEDLRFGEVGFSAQRVLLFLRAVVRNPELVILDEAFSGMDESARDKCLLFLNYGEARTYRLLDANASAEAKGFASLPAAGEARVVESDVSRLGRVRVEGLRPEQALLVVSHNPSEVPGCVREWICLPEAGQGAVRTGRLEGPLGIGGQEGRKRWKEIWGM